MIDLVLLTIVGVSALLGLFRGFVGIVVSTAAWLLGGWASFQFGADAGLWLSDDGTPTASEVFGGYALTFVGVLVFVGLIGMILKSLVRSTNLSGTDRALGFGLGVLRGAFFACVLVLLMGFTPLVREPSWQQSQVLPLLSPVAGWMRAKLPDWSVPEINLPSNPLTGDNGGVESLPALQQAMSQALKPAPLPPSVEGPAGPDPAKVRTGESDPANIESSGQARPKPKQP
ncbi:CvpA family protein [Pseudoxanthomonas sp. UTMC 1351]|uniref:CvpA family protein n=1 Tax=Pseudoxanthomonas sp. UTMC 1351 TaxID=2695853 RepID=UPI0034CE76AD